MTQLYCSNNLTILREKIADESVDLVYLDPPFNSRRDYAMRGKATESNADEGEGGPPALAFGDTWRWDAASDCALADLRIKGADGVAGWIGLLGTLPDGNGQSGGNRGMAAYLAMMGVRLVELRRVLKPTGSLYLHCDPAASHYLKVLLDGLFGPGNFRNEIIWRYSGWNARLRNAFNNRHDVILFYARDEKRQIFSGFTVPWTSEAEYVRIRKQKIRKDADGRRYVLSDAGSGRRVKRYLEEAMRYGQPVDDIWDIPKINNSSKEALGYPTQKPMALLERIIEASSPPDGLVLDPFCGSGTTLFAARKLGRAWIGIDQSPLAIEIAARRLNSPSLESGGACRNAGKLPPG